MTERTSVAVVIEVRDWTPAGVRTWYVGPFMPHAGSAVSRAMAELDDAAEHIDGLRERMLSVVTTFLAPGESDLAGFK